MRSMLSPVEAIVLQDARNGSVHLSFLILVLLAMVTWNKTDLPVTKQSETCELNRSIDGKIDIMNFIRLWLP